MGFSKKFRENLGVALPEERVVERKQGCWNCINWDAEKAVDLWWKTARDVHLAKAVTISMSSPQGEKDQRVKNLRQTCADIDIGMHRAVWGVCAQAGKGGAEAEFVASTYLCPIWSGKQGASVAIAGEGGDKLPGELLAEDDGN